MLLKWVEMKVDGLGGKRTVKSPKSGRSWVKVDGQNRHKVNGLQKWTVQKTKVDRRVKNSCFLRIKNTVQFDRLLLNGPFIFEWLSISRAAYFRSFLKRILDLGTKMTIR